MMRMTCDLWVPAERHGGIGSAVERFTEVGLHIDLDRAESAVVLSPASDHVAGLALLEG